MKKSLLMLLSMPLLISCGNSSEPVPSSAAEGSSPEAGTSIEASSQEESNEVSVFILAGQSNMEGNTLGNTTRMENYCFDNDKDIDDYMYGYPDVQISFYNKYDGSSYNFSNPSSPMEGLFTDVKIGQGVRRSSQYFGPEVGIAEVLSKEELSKPVYLIKYTSGGTGFLDQSRNGESKWNWRSPSSGNTGYLYEHMLEFVHNNLELIEEEGYVPNIKGFLWMQGESDGCDVYNSGRYYNMLSAMISDFREEFSEHPAISFIDAAISDRSVWTYHGTINAAKRRLASEDDLNYIIETNSDGLDLRISNEEHGGGDQYHYTVDSMIRLGNAFGQVMIDNHML